MKKMLIKNWFWLVILLVVGIKYGTAQETVYQYEKLAVTKVKEGRYAFTYGKKNRNYVSEIWTPDEEKVQAIIKAADELLKSRRPGLSKTISIQVDNFIVSRNRWNLYVTFTGEPSTQNIVLSSVRTKRLPAINPAYTPSVRRIYYRPYVPITRYGIRRFYGSWLRY